MQTFQCRWLNGLEVEGRTIGVSKAWVRTDGVEEVGVEEVDGETEYMKEEVIDDSSVLVEETPGCQIRGK